MSSHKETNIIQEPDFLNPYRVKKSNPIENYQILLDEAPDLIFTMDLEGNFLYINKAGLDLFHNTLTELTQKNLLDVATLEHHKAIKEFFKSMRKKRNLPLLEVDALTENGKPVPLEIHFKPIKNNKGIIVSLQGIARNLTERKKIESVIHDSIEKYAAIAEKAKDGVVILQDGICKYANHAVTEFFGYSQKELLGEPLFKKLSPMDGAGLEKQYRMQLSNKKAASTYTATLFSKSKAEKTVEISVSTIQFKGRPADLGLIRDLTHQNIISNKMKEMNRQIERFADITAALILVEGAEDFLEFASQAVVDISDFNRVLISYFKDESPFREIIGHKGITKKQLDRIKNIEMPREKYLKYFNQGIKVGNQSCYIPHNLKDILDQKAVIYGKKSYSSKEGYWHREDNLLVSMKNTLGQVIGIISVDDSKSGLAPTAETVRPLEIFANLISETLQRKILARKIKESEEKYHELITNIKVGIFRMNPSGLILEVNPAAIEMFGYKTMERLIHRNITEFFPQQNISGQFLLEIASNGLIKNKEYCLRRTDGKQFWASITSTAVQNDEKILQYYDTVIEDITKRKELQEDVRRLSITDELTGLFNRRYFNQNLPREIQTAERWRSSLSLIMIDIDDFKNYNDTYHHLKGDELLKQMARIISSNIRKEKVRDGCVTFEDKETSLRDWASRFGGDEFVIILPGAHSEDALKAAERIRKTFQEVEHKPDGTVIHKTISLGIASCSYSSKKSELVSQSKKDKPDYEEAATQLINLADAALFKAKSTGRNKIEIALKEIILVR